MSEPLPHTAPAHSPALGRGWKIVALTLLAVVMALGFAGHLSVDMKLQWENLMALCGF